jgi:hypothetical protein
MKLLTFLKSRSIAGFSIAESVVALGVGGIAIAGGMTLSSHQLRLVKSVRETNAASHALEERIEQLRLVNWKQMTDASYLTQYYFPSSPKSAHVLPGVAERLTVTAYPDASACKPLAIERDAMGAITVLSTGEEFSTQRLARVNVRITWPMDKKVRVRELASIISNAGINANSLPTMGTDSGTTESTETSTTPTDSGTGTGTGTTTPNPTDTTGTSTDTTTTTNGNGNGNGNGQGNIGGKPGKK